MTSTDGRVERGNRSRQAITEALLELYEEGNLTPSIPEVAERAGVSVRSVHNHFVDVEALRADAIRTQIGRMTPILRKPVTNVEELIAQRAQLYEAISPVRRAAMLQVHESPTIMQGLLRGERLSKAQLEGLFRGCKPDTISALELVTSWDAWNRLRTLQGCSVARAKRIVEYAVRTLVEGDTKK